MIPRRPGPDGTLALARRGYLFVSDGCDRLGSDAFRTRLLGRQVVCARGSAAAQVFYTPGRFTRQGAMPTSALHLLQDEGSVQALEGDAHRHRKALFLDIVPQGDPAALLEPFRDEWARAVQRWSAQSRVVLLDGLADLLTRTAARWAGVPMAEGEAGVRTRQLSAMIAGAGTVGPRNWLARLRRRRCERWAARWVRAVREGDRRCRPGSPLDRIATHRTPGGSVLPPEVAAVEVLNILRPVVAVNRFAVFSALALLRHPHWGDVFRGGDESDLLGFVQEVRRLFPFFPLIGGRALEPFEWSGHDFAAGDWMVLDLYGTNHDPHRWPEPEQFRPERFRDWQGDASTLIPQGGGDVTTGHRCPGENATIALMAESIRMMTRTMRYLVPPQDLGIDMRRIPAQPRDGFVIDEVRPLAASADGEPSR